jgi:hypothetical protein
VHARETVFTRKGGLMIALEKPFTQDVILKPECWDDPVECSDLMVVSGFYADWRQLLGVIFDRKMAEIACRHCAVDALERIADAIRQNLCGENDDMGTDSANSRPARPYP